MVDPESGEVDGETILKVLRFHGVETSPDPENPGAMLLVRGTIVKSEPIADWNGRRCVQFLKRTFSIPVHHFYNPEMMVDASRHIN